MTRILFAALFLFSISFKSLAQDTLPRFTVVSKPNGRNIISWTNPFKSISQIGIQRSVDSLRNFTTIMTVPDPRVKQNGFVDTKAPFGHKFYRLFIVLDTGNYIFTNSKRAVTDSTNSFDESFLSEDNQRVKLSDSLSNKELALLKQQKELSYVVKKREEYTIVAESNFKKFRDSILYHTRDTLVFVAVDTILIKPFYAKETYRASRYVYTEKYGNVMISLPDAAQKKYSVAFLEENKKPVFEIKDIKSSSLLVDKANFIHAGWFWYELFEDGKLKERSKLFIPKDF